MGDSQSSHRQNGISSPCWLQLSAELQLFRSNDLENHQFVMICSMGLEYCHILTYKNWVISGVNVVIAYLEHLGYSDWSLIFLMLLYPVRFGIASLPQLQIGHNGTIINLNLRNVAIHSTVNQTVQSCGFHSEA